MRLGTEHRATPGSRDGTRRSSKPPSPSATATNAGLVTPREKNQRERSPCLTGRSPQTSQSPSHHEAQLPKGEKTFQGCCANQAGCPSELCHWVSLLLGAQQAPGSWGVLCRSSRPRYTRRMETPGHCMTQMGHAASSCASGEPSNGSAGSTSLPECAAQACCAVLSEWRPRGTALPKQAALQGRAHCRCRLHRLAAPRAAPVSLHRSAVPAAASSHSSGARH